MIFTQPFKDRNDNIFNIYNEIVIIIVCFSTLYLNLANDLSENLTNGIGWSLVGFVLISLIATWILTLPSAIKEFIRNAKEFISGDNSEEISVEKSTVIPINNKQNQENIKANPKTKSKIKGKTVIKNSKQSRNKANLHINPENTDTKTKMLHSPKHFIELSTKIQKTDKKAFDQIDERLRRINKEKPNKKKPIEKDNLSDV